MYKVTSEILELPYGNGGYTFNGGANTTCFTEWFKRDEESGELTGLTIDEATDLKLLLDKNCTACFRNNTISKTTEMEIPHESSYSIPDDSLPKFFPLKDLKKFRIIEEMPFEEDVIMGYNRFLNN